MTKSTNPYRGAPGAFQRSEHNRSIARQRAMERIAAELRRREEKKARLARRQATLACRACGGNGWATGMIPEPAYAEMVGAYNGPCHGEPFVCA